MTPIKNIVVKNMFKIAVIITAVILILSASIQILSSRRAIVQKANEVFAQVEQILDDNTTESERTRDEYSETCLNDVRMAAYILKYNPAARDDVDELKKIALGLEVDEIHIFDKNGVIVAGTHPEYFGLSFDSGEQMSFFKPLLYDKSLELVQDIAPNTSEGKLVQYSALWSEDGDFIVQIGLYPSSVLRVTQKNELSYIFSLLGTADSTYRLYAVSSRGGSVVGAPAASDLGIGRDELLSGAIFTADSDGESLYCMSRAIGDNFIVFAVPVGEFYGPVIEKELYLLIGLAIIAFILVCSVTAFIEYAVTNRINTVNEDLRAIGEGQLETKVDVNGSKEFSELSSHINRMVQSLLKSSQKLELSERINRQSRELERQNDRLKIANEKAEAASRAKSAFLFSMSHDIRTPMNAVIGFTELALKSDSSGEVTDCLKNIDIASRQLLELMDSILEFSRTESLGVSVDEKPVNLPDEFSKLCTIFQREFDQKKLRISTSCDLKHPYVYTDPALYSRIFMNIVGNAVKFTRKGGCVSISVTQRDGEADGTCFTETVVEDNGIGMSPEFLKRVYDSFAREYSSTQSGAKGVGLGLPIAKNIVDSMGGEINIESAKEKGTRVTVTLPHRIADAPPKADKVPNGKASDDTGELLKGRCILIAEDIDINAMITTKLLNSRGCAVERAADGVECLNLLRQSPSGHYDLILMDIQMPNMDGYSATRAIRELDDAKKASIPILALTANAFKEDCEKALLSGMDGLIAKPLDSGKMFKMITDTLDEDKKQT